MNIKEKLKNIGWTIAGFVLLVVFNLILLFFIKGGVWLSAEVYPWLVTILDFSIFISLFILSPLSFFKKTRGISGVGLVYLSYVFGITLWVWSFLLTYNLWGVIALVIGLFFLGLGVIPIALLATIFNGEWSELGNLILSIVMTFGTRFLGMSIVAKHEEQKESSQWTKTSELDIEEVSVNKHLADTDSMIICPYCGEQIKEEAIKCKHCRKWLKDTA